MKSLSIKHKVVHGSDGTAGRDGSGHGFPDFDGSGEDRVSTFGFSVFY